MAVNGAAAHVVSWQNDAIVIQTRALRPGCNTLSWTHDSSWTPDDNGVGSACMQVLRTPSWAATAGTGAMLAHLTRFWTRPGSLSVMAPRIAAFTASAGVATPAEPCAPVVLSWRVEDLPCPQDRAALRVSLSRDSEILATGLPFVGSFTEAEPIDRDASYELTISSRDAAGQPCAAVQASVTVRRAPKRVELSGPAQVKSSAPATLEIELPCPAPEGGLTLTLSSQPAGSLAHPASVQVAAGSRHIQVNVAAGSTLCGTATLTASAPDHQDGTWSTCVQLAPRIVSFVPPAGLKACERIRLSIEAECVPPELRAFAVDGARGRHPLMISGLGAPGSCAGTRALTLTVPPLPAGTYGLVIESDVGSATAGETFDLAANPRIVRAPTSISVDDPCFAGRRKTLTVTVAGADAVEFTYASVQQTVRRQGSTDVCDTWSATFTFDFDRTGVIDVVPLLGSLRGAALAVDVELTASAAVSVYRLLGPPYRGVRATLTRIETPPGGQPVHSPAGEIAFEEVRDFPLTPCVYTTFEYVYDGAMPSPLPVKLGHPDGEVLGPIGI